MFAVKRNGGYRIGGIRRILARAGVLAAALALVPLPAFAQLDEATLNSRLLALRGQSRFVPDRALVELLKLQPEAADKSPRIRAELLVQLSGARMRLGDNVAALALAEQLIAYGKSVNDNVIVARGMLTKTHVLFEMAEAGAAYQLAFATEKAAMGTGDAALRTEAMIMAGHTYSEQGNFPQALIKLQQAIDMARTVTDDPTMPATALNALVNLYTRMKEYDKASEFMDELLVETEKLKSPGHMALAKTTEYCLAIDSGQLKRALRALLLSLDLERKLGAERMVGVTLTNLSDNYLQQRDYPRAAQYARESLRSAQRTRDESTAGSAHINLGMAYLSMGRVAEGKQHYEIGMARYERENNKSDLQALLHDYGEALERSGDLAGAVSAYHRERELSNELFEKRRQRAVLEVQEKYETEKKRRQIELLSRENQLKDAEIGNRRLQQRIWWLLAAVGALAAAAVGLLYRKVRNANALLEEKNLALKAQSTLDPLTSLYNRRHFQDFMRGHGDDIVGALFLLDVDHFKHVNDTYGHAAGDAVLKMIAEHLRIALRGTDMVVRWGGEEFLAFLPAGPRQGLDEIAHRILTGLSSRTVRHQEHDIAVTVSVGYAPFPLAAGGAPLPWERVVNLIDMALYLAKSNGRNRAYGVRGFANVERTSMEEIEQDLERAWRAGFVDLRVVRGRGQPPAVPAPGNEVPLKRTATGSGC